jgi:dUTP pyrophosphatase
MIAIPVHIQTTGTVPEYAHEADAGFDLSAAIKTQLVLWPGEQKIIPTGLRVALPSGYELQVRSRSGLASKGVIVANSPGTVDAGYRGEIKVILANITTDRPFMIDPGSRIAQGVIAPVIRAEFIPVNDLGNSERGENGFGSTGV